MEERPPPKTAPDRRLIFGGRWAIGLIYFGGDDVDPVCNPILVDDVKLDLDGVTDFEVCKRGRTLAEAKDSLAGGLIYPVVCPPMTQEGHDGRVYRSDHASIHICARRCREGRDQDKSHQKFAHHVLPILTKNFLVPITHNLSKFGHVAKRLRNRDTR